MLTSFEKNECESEKGVTEHSISKILLIELLDYNLLSVS
jgi:hypothetical protein